MDAPQMVKALTEKFGEAVTGSTEFRGEYSLTIKLESLKPLLRYCADELGFDYLIGTCISTIAMSSAAMPCWKSRTSWRIRCATACADPPLTASLSRSSP